MQELIGECNLINYKTRHDKMECMVSHINLDKNISSIFFLLNQVVVLERLNT
jgi:hypothetical protein